MTLKTFIFEIKGTLTTQLVLQHTNVEIAEELAKMAVEAVYNTASQSFSIKSIKPIERSKKHNEK